MRLVAVQAVQVVPSLVVVGARVLPCGKGFGRAVGIVCFCGCSLCSLCCLVVCRCERERERAGRGCAGNFWGMVEPT